MPTVPPIKPPYSDKIDGENSPFKLMKLPIIVNMIAINNPITIKIISK
jgi:hypothetical protein